MIYTSFGPFLIMTVAIGNRWKEEANLILLRWTSELGYYTVEWEWKYSSDHLIFKRSPPSLPPLAYSARPAFAQPAPWLLPITAFSPATKPAFAHSQFPPLHTAEKIFRHLTWIPAKLHFFGFITLILEAQISVPQYSVFLDQISV